MKPFFVRCKAAHLKLGTRGEIMAERLFARYGAEPLGRNWRCRAGELDVIMRDGGELLFIEVKSLHLKPGFAPAGNLSIRQARRNVIAAKSFMRRRELGGYAARFHLVEAVFSRRNKLLTLVRHLDYMPPLYPGTWR